MLWRKLMGGLRHLVFVLLLTACTRSQTKPMIPESKPPTWRTVHFDHVDPDKRLQFENARHEWLRALTDAGITDERGLFIQVGPSTFLTLHAVANFAELDSLQKARRIAPSRLKQAVEKYDRESDGALVPPHHSELWSWADYLDYKPAQGALDERTFGAGFMVVEEVYPGPRGQPYYAAWEQVSPALEKARYPLTRLGFSSSYGGGKVISLWLAKDRAELESAPSILEALTGVLGKERAEALLEQQRSGVVSTERHDVLRRRDLDSPETVKPAGKD
jgi:hypothetical protein